jgi:hypothetical protein
VPDCDDDDRVRAREVICQARLAITAIAGILEFRLLPAVCAKTMALMPVQQRARLRQHPKLPGRQASDHGKASQIHKIISGLGSTGKPTGPTFIAAQEYRFNRARPLMGLQHPVNNTHLVAVQVNPVIGAAVERVSDEGKRRELVHSLSTLSGSLIKKKQILNRIFT